MAQSIKRLLSAQVVVVIPGVLEFVVLPWGSLLSGESPFLLLLSLLMLVFSPSLSLSHIKKYFFFKGK